jgi:hypothetical protein
MLLAMPVPKEWQQPVIVAEIIVLIWLFWRSESGK